MPDTINRGNYNRADDFLNNGYANLNPSAAPTQFPTVEQGGQETATPPTAKEVFDSIGQNLRQTTIEANPFISSNQFITPIKTPLEQTIRYNSSRYGYNPFNPELEHNYAARQGWLSAWKNNILKFGAETGGTFLETVTALPETIKGIATGDFSQIYNNPLSNTIRDWTEGLEQTLPNYQSAFEDQHPFTSYIPGFASLKTLGDKWGGVLKTLGFVVGSVAGAAVQDSLVGAATGGVGELPMLTPQLQALTGKIGKIFASEGGAVKLAESIKNGMAVEDAINGAYNTIRNTDRFRYGLNLFTTATGGSIIFANGVFNDVKNNLSKEYYDKYGRDPQNGDADKITEYARTAGNVDLFANTALQMKIFNNVFSGIFKPVDAVMREAESKIPVALEQGSLDVFKALAPEGKFKILSKIGGPAKTLLNTSLDMAGIYGIQRSAEDYAQRKFDDQSVSDTDNFMRSLGTGLYDTFTSEQGIENILIGVLGGALIHGAKGLIEGTRGIENNSDVVSKNVLSLLNSAKLSDLFKNTYNEAVTADSLSKSMKKAAESGDVFEYQNLKHQQLFNFISSGVRAGKYELRINQLDMLKDLKGSEFEKMFGLDYNDTNSRTVSDYVDNVIRKAKDIKENIDKVDTVFKNPFKEDDRKNYIAFEEYKNQLALDLSEIKNNKERIKDLSSEISKIAPLIDKDKLIDLTHDLGIEQTIKRFEDRIKEIEESQKLLKSPEFTKQDNQEKAFLQEKIKELKTNDQTDYHPDLYNTVGEVVNYYANGNSLSNDNSVHPIDLLGLLRSAQDSFKLENTNNRALYHYQQLTGKKGFDNYIAEVLKNNNINYQRYLDSLANKLANPESPQTITPGDTITIDEQGNPTTEVPKTETKVKVVPREESTQESKEAERARKDYEAKRAEIESRKKKELEAASNQTIEEKKADIEKRRQNELSTVKKISGTLNEQDNVDSVNAKYDKELADLEKQKPGASELSTTKAEEEVDLSEIEKPDNQVITKQAQDTKSEVQGTRKNTIYKKFDPFTYINRIYSKNYEDSKEQDNLRKAVFTNTPQQLYNKIEVNVSKSTKGASKDTYHKVYYTKVYRSGYAHDIDIVHNGDVIGKIQPADTLFYKDGGEYKPLVNIPKDMYKEVTGNDESTYDEFINDLKLYHEITDTLIGQFEETGKKTFTNDEVKKIFNIFVKYGYADYAENAGEATKLSDLNYQSKGDFVISLPNEYDSTGKLVRSGEPSIVNENELDPVDAEKAWQFISDNLKQIKGINSRYVYVTQLPNGNYEKVSPIAARPTEANPEAINNLIGRMTQVSRVTEKADLRKLNSDLRNEIFIDDANAAKNKESKMSLYVTEDGKIYFNIVNSDYKKGLYLPDAKGVKNLQDLVTQINDTIQRKGLEDKGLRDLNIQLKPEDFKSSIGEEASMKDIRSKMTGAVKSPGIFNNYSLHVMPLKAKAPKSFKVREQKELAPEDQSLVSALQASINQVAPELKDKVETVLNAGVDAQKELAETVKSVVENDPEGAKEVLGDKVVNAVKKLPQKEVSLTDKKSVEKAMTDIFNLPKDQAKAVAEIYDRVAKQWAERHGKTKEDFYRNLTVQKGEESNLSPEALRQQNKSVRTIEQKLRDVNPFKEISRLLREGKLEAKDKFQDLLDSFNDMTDEEKKAGLEELKGDIIGNVRDLLSHDNIPTKDIQKIFNLSDGEVETLKAITSNNTDLQEVFSQAAMYPYFQQHFGPVHENIIKEYIKNRERTDGGAAIVRREYDEMLGRMVTWTRGDLLSGRYFPRFTNDSNRIAEKAPITLNQAKSDKGLTVSFRNSIANYLKSRGITSERNEEGEIGSLNAEHGLTPFDDKASMFHDFIDTYLRTGRKVDWNDLLDHMLNGEDYYGQYVIGKLLEQARLLDNKSYNISPLNEQLEKAFKEDNIVFTRDENGNISPVDNEYYLEESQDRAVGKRPLRRLRKQLAKGKNNDFFTASSLLAQKFDIEQMLGRNLNQNAQAAIVMAHDGKATIIALTDPNVSSPLHELAHYWERSLTNDEVSKVLDWAGHDKWTRETSEKFARGFERYLAEGKTETKGLKAIFENFKKWLTDIYKGIVGSDIDIQLNDKMNKIYSDMLGDKYKEEVKQEVAKEVAKEPAPAKKRIVAKKKTNIEQTQEVATKATKKEPSTSKVQVQGQQAPEVQSKESLKVEVEPLINTIPEKNRKLYGPIILDNPDEHLRNIAEQVVDPLSEKTTRDTFGNELTDFALQKFPHAEAPGEDLLAKVKAQQLEDYQNDIPLSDALQKQIDSLPKVEVPNLHAVPDTVEGVNDKYREEFNKMNASLEQLKEKQAELKVKPAQNEDSVVKLEREKEKELQKNSNRWASGAIEDDTYYAEEKKIEDKYDSQIEALQKESADIIEGGVKKLKDYDERITKLEQDINTYKAEWDKELAIAKSQEINTGDKVMYEGKEVVVSDKTESGNGDIVFTVSDGAQGESNVYKDKIYKIDETLGEPVELPPAVEKDLEVGDKVWYKSKQYKVVSTDRENVGIQDTKTGDFKTVVKEAVIPHNDVAENDYTIDYQGLKGILDTLRKRFGIQYQVVNDNEGKWQGRFKDGIVYINKARVDRTTPFHEYLHPFVKVLEIDNPELYNNLRSEFQKLLEEGLDDNAIEAMSETKRNYKDSSPAEQEQEALVRYISKLSAENTTPTGKKAGNQYVRAMKTLIERFGKWLGEMWSRVMGIPLKGIPTDATLQDMADIISLTDYSFDLRSRMDVVDNMDVFQKSADDFNTELLDKLKRNLDKFSKTANRLGSEELGSEAAAIRKIFENKDEAESLNSFVWQGMKGLSWSVDEFSRITGKLKNPDNQHSPEDIQAMNKSLDVIKQMVAFYREDVNDLFKRVGDKKSMDDETYRAYAETLRQANYVADKIQTRSVDLMVEWLYPAIQHTNELIREKYPSFVVSKEDFRNQLYNATGDVDRLFFALGSVGSSKDPVSAIVSNIIKDTVEDAHRYDAAISDIMKTQYDNFLKKEGLANDRKVTAEHYKNNYLRKARILEKVGEDEAGEPTYDYVERWAFHEPYFYDKWVEEYETFVKSLGKTPEDPVEYQNWVNKLEAWQKDNGTINEPAKRFANPVFHDLYAKDRMFSTLYDVYKEGNEKLQAEEQLKYGMLPQVSKGKNMFSDLSWSKVGAINAAKQLGRFFHPNAEEGNEFDVNMTNMDGSAYKKIKTAYLRPLEESDLDLALPETVFKFAGVTNLARSMRELEPNIRTLKSLLDGDSQFIKKARGVVDVIKKSKKNNKGEIVTNTVLSSKKAARLSLVNKQLSAFIDDVVYGDTEVKDVVKTPFGHLDLNKWGNNMAFLTALNNMAFNITAGISNVVIGDIQSFGEALGGKYYKPENYKRAQKQYWGSLPNFMNDISSLKKSKVTQLGIKYDAIQGEFRDKYGKRFVGNVMQKYASADTLFIFNHAGEHHIQLTGMLALMDATKVKLRNGGEVSLYDAHEITPEGYLRLRNDAIWTDQQNNDFTNRLHSLNKILNGNYSKFDKAYLQRKWYGKMALIYRKYLYNAFRARYGKQRLDYELKDVYEGYYRTFFSKLGQDIKAYKFEAARRLLTREGWSADEKYAYNKTLYELGLFTGITMVGIAMAGHESKQDDKSWGKDYLTLLMLRARNDVGQYTLAGIPDMVRIMQNPSAVIQTLSRYGQFFTQLYSQPFETYKRRTGPFAAGSSILQAKMLKAIPIMRQIINLMSPADQQKFFTFNNKNF